MKKTLGGIKVNIKSIFRNKGVLVAILGYIIYLTYYLYLYNKYGSINEVLHLYSNAIIGTIIFFMFLGYYLGRLEKENNCSELLGSIEGYNFISSISKMLSGMIIIGGFTIIITLEVFICYFNKNVHRALYIESLNYIFWYYFIAINLFFIVGLFIGERMKSSSAYGLIFLIWLVFTPLNDYLFHTVYMFMVNDYSYFGSILNIFAPYPLNVHFNGIYGLPIKDYHKVKLIFILSIFIFIFVKKHIQKSKILKVIACFTSICIIFSTIYLYKNFSKMLIEGHYLADHDDIYYLSLNKKEVEKVNELIKDIFYEYDITNCIANLNVGLNFNFNVELEIKSKKETDIISFSLYHGLKIENMVDGNNNKLKHNKNASDVYTVKLNEKIEKGDIVKIKMNYNGYTPASYFIEKEGVYLPPNLAYLPSNKISNQMERKNFYGRVWNNLGCESNYNVTVNGIDNIYSNLKEVSKNNFQGRSKEGVLLLSGRMLEKRTYKNIEYYCNKIYDSNEFEKLINQYVETANQLNERFGFEVDNNIDKVFFVDQSYLTPQYNFPLMKNYKGSLVVTVEGGQVTCDNKYCCQMIAKEICKKNSQSLEELCIQQLFVDSVVGALYDTKALERNQDLAFQAFKSEEKDEELELYKEIVGYDPKEILDFYKDSLQDDKDEFIIKFYKFITEGNIDSKKINNFLNENIK